MIKQTLAAALIAGAAIPAPALAQAASVKSTNDSVSRQGQGLVDGARELKRLAACTYTRTPGYLDTLLATPPGSDAEHAILSRAGHVLENCMNSLAPSIYMSGLEMRGAFAEARYLAANPAPRGYDNGDHAMIAIPAAWTERKMSDDEKLAIVKYDFANCVVAAAPRDADSLLRTEPASKDEGRIVQRLIPQLGPCLQTGSNYQLDAPILRALLAQSLDSSARKWASGGPPPRDAKGK